MAKPPFNSPYAHGLVRVAACTPAIALGEPATNAAATLALARQGHERGAAVMVFPELGLCGYSLDDLVQQDALLTACETAIETLAKGSKGLLPLIAVGAPLRVSGRLYNCAVLIKDGSVLGVVPKTFLPNYREFYERRWFASGTGVTGQTMEVAGRTVPFGVDLLFRAEGPATFTVHAEICEDVWTPNPPSTAGALAGAEVLINLSASNIVIGKADARRLLCGAQSMRCIAAYAYSASGEGESTTDLAWDGHAAIYENGNLLAESERFAAGEAMIIADVDVERMRAERMRTGSFGDSVPAGGGGFRTVPFDFSPPGGDLRLERRIERYPFVPANEERLAEQCWEAYHIQVQGLVQRMRSARVNKLVIGVSGGLDSAHALVVCAKACDQLGLPRTHVLAYSLPGFATGEASRKKGAGLMQALGAAYAEVDIRPAARQMLSDLGHPFAAGEAVYDITFENVQAGLRTDYLFRLANKNNALVVGTGDLSELALGWCTYGVGDHMSHYGVNAGVSKTLIQHLIRHVASSGEVGDEAGAVLREIVAAEITPELIPDRPGVAPQTTEASVGPYALQDFNLYYLTRYGMAPSKIAYLAHCAWGDTAAGRWPAGVPENQRLAYDLPTIKAWLTLFLRRFFANQFKRSAIPNGPKISSGGSLSPRGDWRMPSDASAKAWLDELEANTP